MRVLLAQMPRLLREMFEHEILRGTTLELVDEQRALLNVVAMNSLIPDFVIIGTASPERSRMPSTFLSRWPSARIVAVAPAKGHAFVYELKLQATELGRVSPAELVETICKTMR